MAESEFERNLYAARLETLGKIAEIGVAAGLSVGAATYPNSYEATHTVPELRAAYDGLTAEALEGTVEEPAAKIEVSLTGRVMAIRVQGKAGFAQLQQGGQRFQIYVRKDDVGEALFGLYKLLDLGDHVGVRGFLFRTRTGELTVHVRAIESGPSDAAVAQYRAFLVSQRHTPEDRLDAELSKYRAALPGHALTFLAKAMLALPDKYHGLEDTELRYRQRYVDLIVNSGAQAKAAEGSADEKAEPVLNVREVFEKRAAVLRALRTFFDARGYIEVETPMLVPIAGGAAARPFLTHHNALDYDLSLRIAPELYLKRLVVGGMDRVYEINRNFRNEGIDTSHNPEFTMLEFYQAYSNYWDLMDLTEEIVKFVAMEVNGGLVAEFDGNEIDLGKWTKLSMREAIINFWPKDFGSPPSLDSFQNSDAFKQFLHDSLVHLHEYYPEIRVPSNEVKGVDIERHRRLRSLLLMINGQYILLRGGPVNIPGFLEAFGLPPSPINLPSQPLGKTIAGVFEAIAEPHLIQPTIIYDFPLAVSPLSKQKADEPDWVERFEFYIGGFEVGNAFSELNDPEEQRRRFAAQVAERERGDEEAHPIDEDYVRALGYGLPPTAGEGIGIDRLTMVLTGAKSIRDVILFPLMRPIKGSSGVEEEGVASPS